MPAQSAAQTTAASAVNMSAQQAPRRRPVERERRSSGLVLHRRRCRRHGCHMRASERLRAMSMS